MALGRLVVGMAHVSVPRQMPAGISYVKLLILSVILSLSVPIVLALLPNVVLSRNLVNLSGTPLLTFVLEPATPFVTPGVRSLP